MPWQIQTYICSSFVCHRFLLAKCSKSEGKMSKKCKVNWSDIDGASPKSKRLHLVKDDADSLYHCPIQLCEHEGFQSQRACRKHVNNKYSWFFYFDEKPRVDLKLGANSLKVPTKSSASSTNDDDDDVSSTRSKPGARSMPSLSTTSQIGEQFATWLSGGGGGYKKDRPTQQIVNRCLKFLKFCCEEEEELNFEVMDFSLCSPSLLFKFIDYLQEECKLGHGGRLGYIDAILELIDFRKVNGASDGVLRKSATELYIKRAHKTVAKMMRLQWTQDLDVGTLEAWGHWATMEELLEVVSFHLLCYEQTVKTSQNDGGQVNPSDLTFATKFLATYLFIKVKGSRPMTYQYLTVDMVKAAKEMGVSSIRKTLKRLESTDLTL